MKVKVKLLSHVWLFATPWTVAHQTLPSMEFSRQEHWSGLSFSSPRDLPDPGIEPRCPTMQADTLPSEPPGKQEGQICTGIHSKSVSPMVLTCLHYREDTANLSLHCGCFRGLNEAMSLKLSQKTKNWENESLGRLIGSPEPLKKEETSTLLYIRWPLSHRTCLFYVLYSYCNNIFHLRLDLSLGLELMITQHNNISYSWVGSS